jgi:hypothetical protein
MNKVQTLRLARNILMSLHKSLLDFERIGFEQLHGKMNAGQFLNVLLENESFAWLRKFSMLIVEIDEMFDLKDGISDEMVESNITKIRELLSMNVPDENFRGRYRFALDNDKFAATEHSRLAAVVSSRQN